MEEVFRCTRFHTANEVGIRLCATEDVCVAGLYYVCVFVQLDGYQLVRGKMPM